MLLSNDEKNLKEIENYVSSHFPELNLEKLKNPGNNEVFLWKLIVPNDIWQIIKYQSHRPYTIQINNNFIVRDDTIDLDVNNWNDCSTYSLYDCNDMKKLYETIDRLHLQYKTWKNNIRLLEIEKDFS